MKIIYDLGANNGDDIPYYLLKADRVVSVEANPALCQLIHDRFPAEIESGKLIVENCVLTSSDEGTTVDFYLHKTDHEKSQFPRPADQHLAEFEPMRLPAKSFSNLIRAHGQPFYVKIDIEHYDCEILRAMIQANITPPYISAEAHRAEVFVLLFQMGYRSFKLVDGYEVGKLYQNHPIESQGKRLTHAFPQGSTGPFGNEVKGPWFTPENFIKQLALLDFGWRDIHASMVDASDPNDVIPHSALVMRPVAILKNSLKAKVKRRLGVSNP